MSGGVAIVTGGSRGLGASVSERLAADGYKVVVNYTSNAAAADQVVAAIKAKGGSALAVKANVAMPNEVNALFDAAEAFGGGAGTVTLLVNNAGIGMPGNVMCADVTEESLTALIDINLKGTIYGCQQAAKRLPDGGRIINVSSTLVSTSLPGYSVYSATKAAVECLTRSLAKELGGRQISVTCVAPGPCDTELLREGKSEALLAHLANMSPMKRLGTGEDIASICSFLAKKEAAWCSGNVVRANGGWEGSR